MKILEHRQLTDLKPAKAITIFLKLTRRCLLLIRACSEHKR